MTQIATPHSTEIRSQPDSVFPSFSTFIDEFLRDFDGWSDIIRRSLSGVLRNLRAKFGPIPIDQITPRQIQDLNQRRREGLSATTCNRYLAAFTTMLESARIWGYLVASPATEGDSVRSHRPSGGTE
jgi:hypothetical protein